MSETIGVRLPLFLWVSGTILTVCLGASSFVASQQSYHEHAPGHAETRERLGRMEQQTKDADRRLGNIEQSQDKMRENMEAGFRDVLRAIQGH